MLSTLTFTAARAVQPTSMSAVCCPRCGSSTHVLEEAQRQIDDLQSQVRLLNEKATAAVDRWADYEDELAKLRAELRASEKKQQPSPSPAPQQQQQQQQHQRSLTPPRPSLLSAGGLTALLSPRKALPTPGPSPQRNTPNVLPVTPVVGDGASLSTSPSSNDELLQALSREQSLRCAAERRLSDSSREVEELSVQLFEQANEMVADERRARAALEERVGELERRDVEKRRRLERLESALGRIERVRTMLDSGAIRNGETGN